MKFYVTSKISDNIHMTPEGFMVCVGVPIAHTDPMVYGDGETPIKTDDEGKVLIHRKEQELFRPETMASFEGKPITITHPTEFVSSENWARLAKGMMQNIRRGEGKHENDLIADLLITDKMAIDMVKSGLREVSCGYEAEYVQTGEGRGLQKKIVGNHLALVEEGRAGPAYAINDHKGKGSHMKFSEKLKAIFAKVQDEAEKEEAKKDDKAKDESKPDDKKDESKDTAAYDELVKMVKDLGEKISAMGSAKPKDDAGNPAAGESAAPVAKDEEAPAEVSMEDRLKALEAAVAKLLENKADAGDEEGEEADLAEDEGSEEDMESEDDAMEGEMVGDTSDTASRVEILAPGMKASAKDAKAQALRAAYATADGKAVIDQLTGGKAPDLKDESKVSMYFIAASELLKISRNADLSKTKTRDFGSSAAGAPKGAISAEEMNAINAKHYGKN